MGPNFDDESSPSILVRYSSENDSEDLVFPADPRLVQAQLDAQHQPLPPPPPPASPVSGVFTSSTTPLPDIWSLERSLTPSPTIDSPEKPIVSSEDARALTNAQVTLCISNLDFTEANANTNSEPYQIAFKLCSTALDSVRGHEKRRLLDIIGGIEEEYEEETEPCCIGCWEPFRRIVMGATFRALSNIHRNLMEWAMMYSGRPSSSRQQPQDTQSVAEKERQKAEEFVKENSHIPLDSLLAQNKEAQILKSKEYDEMRKRKAPCLADQPRGENGRIIFSQEYIDFMLYRDLQPLVDLRNLRHVEDIVLQKIRERDDQQLVEQLKENTISDNNQEEPKTSTSSVTSL